jgi:hypothetical protein
MNANDPILKKGHRYLKSRANGRIFIWDKSLSELSHMEEFVYDGSAAAPVAKKDTENGPAASIADVVGRNGETIDELVATGQVVELEPIDLTKKPEPVDYELRRVELDKLTKKQIAEQLRNMFGRIVNYQLSSKKDLIDMCIASEKNQRGDE